MKSTRGTPVSMSSPSAPSRSPKSSSNNNSNNYFDGNGGGKVVNSNNMIHWIENVANPKLLQLQILHPKNLIEVHEMSQGLDEIEYDSMKQLNMHGMWPNNDDDQNTNTSISQGRQAGERIAIVANNQEELQIGDFLKQLKHQKTRMRLLQGFHRQLNELNQLQLKALHQAKDIALNLGSEKLSNSKILDSKIYRLQHAMQSVTSGMQQGDILLETHRCWSGYSNEDIQTMTNLLKKQKQSIIRLSAQVQEAISLLKNEKSTLIIREKVKNILNSLESYLEDCLAAYETFGVGITASETRRYMEVLAQAKVDFQKIFEEGNKIIEVYCNQRNGSQQHVTETTVWKRGLFDNYQQLSLTVLEIENRLNCAFTIFSTLDELLYETEELLIQVSSDKPKSPRSSPLKEERHLIEKSNYIWKEYVKVEKLCSDLIGSLKKEFSRRSKLGHFKDQAVDKEAMINTTELVLKMKLFTLWYKLQELLKISGANEDLRERIRRRTIQFNSSSIDEEDLMQYNLRLHMKETSNEIHRSVEKCNALSESEDPQELKKSLQILESIQKEMKSTLDTFHEELQAMNKNDRQIVISESRQQVDREYVTFMQQWQEKYTRLFNKSIASRTLVEIQNRLNEADNTMEQILREFSSCPPTQLSNKLRNLFKSSIKELHGQLQVINEELNKNSDAPSIVHDSDAINHFHQLTRQNANCNTRLHLFTNILDDLDKIYDFNNQSNELLEAIEQLLYTRPMPQQTALTMSAADEQLNRLLKLDMESVCESLKNHSMELWGILPHLVNSAFNQCKENNEKLKFINNLMTTYTSAGAGAVVDSAPSNSLPINNKETLLIEEKETKKTTILSPLLTTSQGPNQHHVEVITRQKLHLEHRIEQMDEQTHFVNWIWFKNNKAIGDVNEFGYKMTRTNSITFILEKEHVDLNDQGIFTLQITTNNGQNLLDLISFEVNIFQAPEFIEIPAKEININENCSLDLRYRIKSNPPAEITWLLNNHPIQVNWGPLIGSQAHRNNVILAERNNEYFTLIIPNICKENSGIYCCVAVNEYGVKENLTTITIQQDKKKLNLQNQNESLKITRPLEQKMIANNGDKFVLDVGFNIIDNSDNSDVIWFFNGQEIDTLPHAQIIIFSSRSTLTFNPINKDYHEGSYKVKICLSNGNFVESSCELIVKTSEDQNSLSTSQISPFVEKEKLICSPTPEPIMLSQPKSSSSSNNAVTKTAVVVNLESSGKSFACREGEVFSENLQFYWMLEEFDYVQEELCWMNCDDFTAGEAHFSIKINQPSYVLWYVNGILVGDGMKTQEFSLDILKNQNNYIYHDETLHSFSFVVHNIHKSTHNGNCYSVITMKDGREVLTNFLLLIKSIEKEPDKAVSEDKMSFEKRIPQIRKVSDTGTSELNWYHDSPTEKSTATTKQNVRQAPEFHTIFQDIVGNSGQTVEFKCKLHSSPKCDIWWTFNGQGISARCRATRKEISSNVEELVLQLENVEMIDSGRYSITAENDFGLAGCSALLVVNDSTHKTKPQSPPRVPMRRYREQIESGSEYKDETANNEYLSEKSKNQNENESATTTTTTRSVHEQHHVWKTYRKTLTKRKVFPDSDN